MKKVILSLLLVAPVLLASAQVGGRKFALGVNAGVSLFKETASTENISANSSSKAGFVAGVNAVFPIASSFYIQPEINFQQEGGKAKSDGVDYKDKLNYINIPVLAKYRFSKTRLSAYVGPQFGILTSAKTSFEEGGSTYNLNIKDNCKSTEFAGVYGLEYYFPVTGQTSIVVNARYQSGFTNIAKDVDYKIKNNGFAFTVGYRF